MVNAKKHKSEQSLSCCEKECLPICCKECPKCPDCYDLDEHRLRDILYAIDTKICELSESYICLTMWGYSKESQPLEKIEVLNTLKPVIQKYELASRFGLDTCLCPHEINAIIEKVLCLIDLTCCNSEKRCDIIIDESGLDSYISSNPHCVAYDDWERCLYRVMPQCETQVVYGGLTKDPYEVEVSVNRLTPAEFLFSASRDEIVVEPELAYLLTAERISPTNFSLDVDLKETKDDVSAEISAIMELSSLSEEVSAKMVDFGITSTAILKLQENNISVGFDAAAQSPTLTFENNASILLSDFQSTIIGEDANNKIESSIAANSKNNELVSNFFGKNIDADIISLIEASQNINDFIAQIEGKNE